MARNVVLVNENDEKLGLADIWDAHKNPGQLHRAISVLLWRDSGDGGEVLLQLRSKLKPLWPIFWSNTCCTHPYDKESYIDCAQRRLKEEVGIKIAKRKLKKIYTFRYQADYDDKLSEHEVDTVVMGKYEGNFVLNKDEAAEASWVKWKWLKKEIEQNFYKYTPWFVMMVRDERLGEILE